MLYVSLIHPHILYCDFVIDGATITEKKKLQTQQNSALRAVCNVDYGYPTAKLFSDVSVDNVSVCMMKTCCKIVYRGLNNMGPPAINDMFEYYTPSRELRSGEALLATVQRCKTQFGTKNLRIRGPSYWNQLPHSIKCSTSIDTFKQNIKAYTGFGWAETIVKVSKIRCYVNHNELSVMLYYIKLYVYYLCTTKYVYSFSPLCFVLCGATCIALPS